MPVRSACDNVRLPEVKSGLQRSLMTVGHPARSLSCLHRTGNFLHGRLGGPVRRSHAPPSSSSRRALALARPSAEPGQSTAQACRVAHPTMASELCRSVVDVTDSDRILRHCASSLLQSAEYALPVYGRFALVKWHRIVSSGALLTPVMRPQDVSPSPCTDELPAVPGGMISASGPGSGEIGGDAPAGRWDATMGTLAWPETTGPP
jgi:hypothetical protein